MVVMKFGGTSVADAPAVSRLVEIVTREQRPEVVVVSALAGVTDTLTGIIELKSNGDLRRAMTRVKELHHRHVELARAVSPDRVGHRLLITLRRYFSELGALVRAAAVLRQVSPACRDAMLAYGELASSRIVAAALRAAAVPAEWVDARKIVVTDDRHTRAIPLMEETTERIDRLVRPRLDRGRSVVVGGFVGATREGATTTLGRGGSDYSAAIIGSCLQAEEIQIWTDVDGMLSADPKLVRSPRLLSHLSFEDASALARFGAKILHPATLAPARARNIPVRILNSYRVPEGPVASDTQIGTLITGTVSGNQSVAGFASKTHLTVTQIQPRPEISHEAVLARAATALERAGISLDLTAIADTGVSLVHDSRGVTVLQEALTPYAEVRSQPRLAMVCAVGEGLRNRTEMSSRLLAALDGIPVVMVSQAAHGRTLACVIPEFALGQALTRLYREHVDEDPPAEIPVSKEAVIRA